MSSDEIVNRIKSNTILFFDMDGTLVDTNRANFLAYKKAIEQVTNFGHGLVFNSEERFTRSYLVRVIPDLPQNVYDEIILQKETYYEQFLPNTTLIGNVAEILFKYSETHKTVLVTNCRKNRAIVTLNHFRLTDKFDHILFREFAKNDEKINKYQNAIIKLGVRPELIIAFEDEEIEIRDAQNVGISVINPKLL
jgi:beta-phosphoglucomutase